jgi:hypothetical protein
MEPKSVFLLFAVFKGLCRPYLFVPLLCFTFIFIVLVLNPDRPFSAKSHRTCVLCFHLLFIS